MVEIRKKPNRDYEDYLTVGRNRALFSMCKSLGLSFQKWVNNNKTLKTRWRYYIGPSGLMLLYLLTEHAARKG